MPELNLDGLVGPTHNYAGLSHGNLASQSHKGEVSDPRQAALQGLAKMRLLVNAGLPQSFLPPHERPFLPFLREFGFSGNDADILAETSRKAPLLLHQASSASCMWTANAATIGPSADSEEQKLCFSPANLLSMPHRSLEASTTTRLLRYIFADSKYFSVFDPLPGHMDFADEGAANHNRLCAEHGAPGLQLFVFGRDAYAEPKKKTGFPARQSLQASQAVARRHRLDDKQVMYIAQNPHAIDAGVFHHDVVGVTNAQVMLYHETAFDRPDQIEIEIKHRCEMLEFVPKFLRITQQEVPVADAISSYLFNSQLVTYPHGKMGLILPQQVQETPSARTCVERLLAENNPIEQADYLDLRQSMSNGGGPACLRLRVATTDEQLAAMHSPMLLDETRLDWLEGWVRRHYRDRLSAVDLADPQLLAEGHSALQELTDYFELGSIYDFQRE